MCVRQDKGGLLVGCLCDFSLRVATGQSRTESHFLCMDATAHFALSPGRL